MQDIACRKLIGNYLTMYGKQLGGPGSDLYRATEERFRLAIDENRYGRLLEKN
jgi:hypothetical protein